VPQVGKSKTQARHNQREREREPGKDRERERKREREREREREKTRPGYIQRAKRRNEKEEEVGSSACLGSIPDHRRWFINSKELKRP